MKTYWHATDYNNLLSIYSKGILANNIEHCVFLCETEQDAAKVLVIRGCKKILLCQVEVDKDKVIESFDHNQEFFRCKAYMYPQDIPSNQIKQYRVINLETSE